MKASEVRELNNEELVAKLADLKKELFNLRLSHATGQTLLRWQMSRKTSQESRQFSAKENSRRKRR